MIEFKSLNIVILIVGLNFNQGKKLNFNSNLFDIIYLN